MPTLHDLIPDPRLSEHDEVATQATPARALELARHFDIARSPIVHALFWLRTIPERLSASGPSKPLELRLDAIGRSGDGFRVLEESDERLVVGAIGRFWQSHIEFAPVEPAEFAAFREPGWGKVAWQLTAAPADGSSRVCFDLAVTATDDDAWRKLARYFRVIGPFSRFIRRHELRSIARELDAESAAEDPVRLPGDAWIANPRAIATDVIAIDAPPAAVWPWLVQMGCDRAGWYSYDLLDNAGVPSASEIRDELQTFVWATCCR